MPGRTLGIATGQAFRQRTVRVPPLRRHSDVVGHRPHQRMRELDPAASEADEPGCFGLAESVAAVYVAQASGRGIHLRYRATPRRGRD